MNIQALFKLPCSSCSSLMFSPSHLCLTASLWSASVVYLIGLARAVIIIWLFSAVLKSSAVVCLF